MTNLSWNNSSRAEFYSKQYATELQTVKEYVDTHLLGGLKFLSWQDIELMLKLKWHEDSVYSLNCGIQLSKEDYKISCHCNDPIPVNRFFYVSNIEDSFFENYYEVADVVRILETNLQLKKGLAIEASPNPEDLGYVPNLKKEFYYTILTPLTWESIERFPLPIRNKKIKETNVNCGDLAYLLKKSQEAIDLLLWGSNNSFEIKSIKKAKEGDTRAADALNLVY